MSDEVPWQEYTEIQIIADLDKRNRPTTPDFRERKLEHDIPVMVYGTLKMGGRFHDLVEGAPFLGDCYTMQDNFMMKETDTFPVAFQMGTITQKLQKAKGRLFGEAYVVDPKRLLELDRLEMNGRMYRRKLIWVKLVDQPSVGTVKPIIQAWTYLAVPEYWKDYPLGSLKTKDSSSGPMYEWGSRR